jgi:hypothetical protein
MTEERNDAMHTAGSRSTEALDRLLALRPEDLDGWEEEAAAALDPELRAQEEALDAALSGLLERWIDVEQPEPAITAADFVGLPQDPVEPGEFGPGVAPTRRLRLGVRSVPTWLTPAALAACLALVAFGSWQIQRHGGPAVDDAIGIKAVTPEVVTRVELNFSVERALPGGVVVEPGRRDATYGATDHLALEVAVQGEGGWLYLFEERGGDAAQIWPGPGAAEPVPAGVHRLTDGQQPVVWQPDELAGRTGYLAVVSSEQLPPDLAATIAREVLASADRPDLWPRPVLAADSFTVDWEHGSTP